jgi:hypothetical protein
MGRAEPVACVNCLPVSGHPRGGGRSLTICAGCPDHLQVLLSGRFGAAKPRAHALTRELTFRSLQHCQAGLTMCNRSITLPPCSTSKHTLSSPFGSTIWQTPRFKALWSLGSSGLNEDFSATWSRWATVSPSFASISGPDGACTSRSVVASLLSCWLADPSAHKRATSGARRH